MKIHWDDEYLLGWLRQFEQALDDKQAARGVMFRTLMRRIRLVLVSDGLTVEDARMMGIDFYSSVEAAVAAEIDRLPSRDVKGPGRILAQGCRGG